MLGCSTTAHGRGASGPLADIDPTTYANKAAQLEVLPTLAELTNSGQLSQASRITLLSLMCAAIAAFDLSPYTLSASQLQAVIETLANLYEGKALAMQLLNRQRAVTRLLWNGLQTGARYKK